MPRSNSILFVLFLALTSTGPASAGSFPPQLRISYYSNSKLAAPSTRYCEGSSDDIALRSGRRNEKFDDYSLDGDSPQAVPRMIALHRDYHALGKCLHFSNGPFAGKTIKVGDYNPARDTIAVPLDTRKAKDEMDCQKMIKKGAWFKSPSVSAEIVDCPAESSNSTNPAGPSGNSTPFNEETMPREPGVGVD